MFKEPLINIVFVPPKSSKTSKNGTAEYVPFSVAPPAGANDQLAAANSQAGTSSSSAAVTFMIGSSVSFVPSSP